MNDLVSIISPCYNGAKYLPDYFEGILSQVHRNIELIFINDGSTDETEKVALEYVEKFKDAGMRFVYIYQDNAGQAAAVNKGLSIFKGDYLTWLDSDDIMLPENISKKLDALKSNLDCDFSVSEIEIVNANNKDKIIGYRKRIRPTGEDTYFEDLIYSRNIVWVPGTVLVRREHLLKVIPERHIYESREGQNWQLMLPITYKSKCYYVEEPLLKCVEHNDSHSRQERSPRDEIDREKNMITLCSETVMNILRMSEDEKYYWCKNIRIYHNRNCLNIANVARYRATYNSIKKLLIEDRYRISFKERYFWGLLINIKRKIIE